MKNVLLALIVAALMSGCCSVRIAKTGENHSVMVQNSCTKLFCLLPIVSGDPDYPDQDVCRWFENTATMETNIKLLDAAMKREGATDYKSVHSYRHEESLCLFFLKRYTMITSAELTK